MMIKVNLPYGLRWCLMICDPYKKGTRRAYFSVVIVNINNNGDSFMGNLCDLLQSRRALEDAQKLWRELRNQRGWNEWKEVSNKIDFLFGCLRRARRDLAALEENGNSGTVFSTLVEILGRQTAEAAPFSLLYVAERYLSLSQGLQQNANRSPAPVTGFHSHTRRSR